MPCPIFKVGDEVETELSENSNYPRYNNMIDRGSSGKWIRGKVTGVEYNTIKASFTTADNNSYNWEWNNIDKRTDEYWSLPGQLRSVKPIEKSPYSFSKGYFKDLLNEGYFPELEERLLGKRKYR